MKTSGKTGLHVAVPIRRTLTFEVVREIAHVVGARLVRAHPQAVTLEWSIGKRTGKVFIDANMNVRGKSMTAPYSPRGLPGAPVSMPLEWTDLAQAGVGDFHVANVPAKVAREGDAWARWLSRKSSVEAALAATAR